MPYLDGGELFYAIHPNDGAQPAYVTQAERAALPEAQARIYFRQILECANFLHSRNVAHLDISPENIMLNNGRCILIDLGGARPVPVAPNGDGKRALFHPSNVPFGKKQYLPFEVLKGDSFDGFAVDLWSVMITLFHMLVGDTLGPSATWVLRYETFLEFLSHSTHLRFLLEGRNGYAINLLDKILRRNPPARATLEQLTQDAWVSSLVMPFLPLEHYLAPLP
jgi:serine/threonine protein kinase